MQRVAKVAQQALYIAVDRLEQTGHELVLVAGPGGVGHESLHLLGHHLQVELRRIVEDALAQSQRIGCQWFHRAAQGAGMRQIDKSHGLQVLAVREARVLQRDVDVGVGLAEDGDAVHVPERHLFQVLVVAEGALLDIVQVVVVPVAHIVEQTQRTAVLLEEVVVGLVGIEVLYLVTHAVADVARRIVFVSVGVLHAVAAGSFLLCNIGGGEIPLVLSPRLVVEEVLIAVLAHDDAQLCGVATCEDAVADEHEVLGTEGCLTALGCLVAQVDGL